jgi:hypothetical protein
MDGCRQCDAGLTEGAAFCGLCGAPTTVRFLTCPSCGGQMGADSAFCESCGARVNSSSAPARDPRAPDTIPGSTEEASGAERAGSPKGRRLVAAGRPCRERSRLWFYYAALTILSVVSAFVSSPWMAIAAVLFGAYAVYLFRGGSVRIYFGLSPVFVVIAAVLFVVVMVAYSCSH